MSNVYDPRLRELESLKAQLARAEFDLRRKDCSTCHGSGEFQDSTDGGIWVRCHCWANRVDEIKRASEAQVRELRAFVEHFKNFAPNCSQLLDGWHQDGTAWSEWGESVRKELSALTTAAYALRSAPPSGPKYVFEGTVKMRNTGGEGYEIVGNAHTTLATADLPLTQAPFDKTDAREERKDLARQVPAQGIAPASDKDGVAVGLENLPSDSPRSETSGPQDSPSRPKWISLEERLPDESLGYVIVALDFPRFQEWSRQSYDNQRFFERSGSFNVEVWNTVAVRHWAKEENWLTHWQPLPAPPSPAREPEIVVPALPNKPIDYPVKYRNDEPARELEIHQPTYEAPEIFRQRLRDGEKEKAE